MATTIIPVVENNNDDDNNNMITNNTDNNTNIGAVEVTTSPSSSPFLLETLKSSSKKNNVLSSAAREEIVALIREETGRNKPTFIKVNVDEEKALHHHPEEEVVLATSSETEDEEEQERKKLKKKNVKGKDKKKDEEEEEEEEVKPMLVEDTYSFLAFTPFNSKAFALSVMTMAIQAFSLIVVLTDQFVDGTPGNALGVPPFVKIPVRITQVIALTLSVILQIDTLWSINLLFKGFKAFERSYNQVHCSNGKSLNDKVDNNNPKSLKEDKQVKQANEEKAETTIKCLKLRWWISNLARLWQGFFCLAIMFMLIMKADTGRAVLLSFNIINFIAGFAKAVFVLTKWGYFSDAAKANAQDPLIGEVDMDITMKGKAHLPRHIPLGERLLADSKILAWKSLRSLSVFLVWGTLMSMWVWFSTKQLRGEFLPVRGQ